MQYVKLNCASLENFQKMKNRRYKNMVKYVRKCAKKAKNRTFFPEFRPILGIARISVRPAGNAFFKQLF